MSDNEPRIDGTEFPPADPTAGEQQLARFDLPDSASPFGEPGSHLTDWSDQEFEPLPERNHLPHDERSAGQPPALAEDVSSSAHEALPSAFSDSATMSPFSEASGVPTWSEESSGSNATGAPMPFPKISTPASISSDAFAPPGSVPPARPFADSVLNLDTAAGDEPLPSPREAAYQIAFKLLGTRAAATTVADAAAGRVNVADSGEPTAGNAHAEAAALLSAATAAVQASLASRPGLREDGTLSRETVSHLSHRDRICRDLGRWNAADAACLALRHLAGLPPEVVAHVTMRPESDVRAITSTWVRTDAFSSGEMLNNLDSWIGAGLGPSTETTESEATLEHLADPTGARSES